MTFVRNWFRTFVAALDSKHEKAVDVATMTSGRRSDPQYILLRGQKREVFALSATYPLIEVLRKKNRSIRHPLLEKIVPKPTQRILSAPSQRLENSISRFDRRPTCPAATTDCYEPPLCIRPIVIEMVFAERKKKARSTKLCLQFFNVCPRT